MTAALMFKKILFQFHWFLGITAGLILSIMGVTGAIYSYDQAILKLINPDSYTVQAEAKAKLSAAEIYQHFYSTQPEMKINSITIATEPTTSSVVNIVKEGAKRGQNLMINPYSAEKLPDVRGQEFFNFIKKLHRTLTLGAFGKSLTGACVLILIFFVLSGLYFRWPKKHSWRQWFALKPKLKGRNFIWDLHAVVGTWVCVFYIIIAVTGLTWSYSWWRSGFYAVLAVDSPQQKQAKAEKPEMGGKETPHSAQQSHNATERAAKMPRSTQVKSEHSKHNKLDPQQIYRALNQTSLTFPQQLQREYSSLTYKIPKQNNQQLELSFLDAKPQHERANNTATYDYNRKQIVELNIYADKTMNEKIAGSILPVHRGSFFGPLYQFFAMLASLAMPLFFVTGWLLYLKRRKQKQLTLAAKNSGQGLQVQTDSRPWLIVYASQTGVSEQLAWGTASSLQQAQQIVEVKAIQHLKVEDVQHASRVLFVLSTYGTGEAPDLAHGFAKKMLSSNLSLSHLQYAVLALGSSDYPETFCAFGHQVDAWLKHNGAHPLFDLIEVDNANPDAIQAWQTALTQATQLDLDQLKLSHDFDEWRLIKRECLNTGSQGAEVYQLELQALAETSWQAGDIAVLQPGNSKARIQTFIEQYQLDGNSVVANQQPLSDYLRHKDLTQALTISNDLDTVLTQLNDLPCREYSIASIPEQHVLRLVVRQKWDTEQQLGLGSGWLTQHVALRDHVLVRIRDNPSFHLIDDQRPIICIGNGTGIAGLISLLSARVHAQNSENWLIFGERQQAHDFLFQDTIQTWQNTAMLKRVDLAFSRDQAEKFYVHHILRQQSEELKAWIAQGAVIYVCGSIQGMATDVDQALTDILGEVQLAALRDSGHYRRDVY